MRTIWIIEHVSSDGGIQGPGGPGEDRENGFAHGGWAFPHRLDESGAAIVNAHGAPGGLALIESKAAPTGFILFTCKPAGAMPTGSFFKGGEA